MKNIIIKVRETLAIKPNTVIVIDGCCASGKSTLAAMLAEKFDSQIIRMDDFFLPFEMRTEQRLAQTGGNVHYERFNDEVVSGIKSGKEFDYRVFCCKTGSFSETKAINPDKPIIIEGSYSLHPEIPDIGDLKIFLKVDYNTQLERILKRNGGEALETFKTKWIPFENKYFAEFNIESRCDIIYVNK